MAGAGPLLPAAFYGRDIAPIDHRPASLDPPFRVGGMLTCDIVHTALAPSTGGAFAGPSDLEAAGRRPRPPREQGWSGQFEARGDRPRRR